MNLAKNITDWIFLLSLILAFYVSFFYRRRKDLFPIQLYILITLLINVVGTYIENVFTNDTGIKLVHALTNIFLLFELSIFYYFLYIRIKGRIFRIVMKLLFCTFVLGCFVYWLTHPHAFFSFIPSLFGLDGMITTIPCFFYIYEIINSDLDINLKEDANFIICCGILFYSSIMVPTYFTWHDLYALYGFTVVFNIGYTIFSILLIITFLKAYLCPNTALEL